MLQIIKSLWNYGSGETAEALAQNQKNNDEVESKDTRLDSRYLRYDANLNRSSGKSIFDRKISGFDKATYQIELISRIYNADSDAQLNELQNDINNAGFDRQNREIVESLLQERRENLQRSQSV
ncbi:hypothetical protein M3P05_15285 [Sansalvadorimonas sp. 2012CJ34-2]|uniref:Uncharacterized protein n=1 Tax=Parendozoicomonas callyspongiae TaxID=2942213 RepID=A0ABT0PIW0_9GAMM|nr:hypothetical protein [Sansalvadorimonas sp. 2012CJ34-2]MCL6271289.1 hypothetical protein [Sansalvadorimonas sp. 2012CJ34-2]